MLFLYTSQNPKFTSKSIFVTWADEDNTAVFCNGPIFLSDIQNKIKYDSVFLVTLN